MADDVTLPATGTGTADIKVATDNIGGSQYQRVKLSVGDDGAAADAKSGGGTEAGSLRVTIASDSTGLVSVDDNGGSLTVDGTVAVSGSVAVTGPLTDTQLRATAVPVSGTVTTGGLTDTQLRATAVPVSGTLTAVTTVGTVTNVVHVDDNASTLSVDDGGGSITVDGTFFQATQPVSGTVTANAGTNLNTSALALDATLGTTNTEIGGLTETAPASDTASSGLNGRLQRIAQRLTSILAKLPALGTAGTPSADVITVQGVTSMTALKVDGSGVTQPVSGTVTATVGTVTAVTTVGTITNVVHVDDNASTLSVDDGAGSLTVDNGGTFAVQAAGDVAAAATDSGNPVKTGGYASSAQPTAVTAGQRVNTWHGLRGETIVGGLLASSADGVTANVVQLASSSGSSGRLDVVTEVFNGTNFDRSRSIINANDTTGTGITAAGILGQFDDTSPGTVTENRFGNLRMSVRREAYQQIRDAAGNERGANVTAGNALVVDGSAVTQPVSGTVTATVGTVTAVTTVGTITNVVHVDDNAGSITVDGTVTANAGTNLNTSALALEAGNLATVAALAKAEDAVHASGNTGVMALAVRNDAGGSLAGTDGDYIPLTTDANGALRVLSTGGAAGTEYTEGDTDASITGTAILWEDGSDTLRSVSAAKPLPVGDAGGSLTVDGTFWQATQPVSGTVTATVGTVTAVTTVGTVTNVVHVDDNAGTLSVDDGAGSLTVDYATTGSGNATGALRVELANNGTGVLATVGAVTAITNALPAGTNAIGKLAANSGVTIGAVEIAAAQTLATVTTVSTVSAVTAVGTVTPGTAATSLGKAEDAAHASADVGVMALAVRSNTAASTSGTDGDYQPLITNTTGHLWVDASGQTLTVGSHAVTDGGGSLTVDGTVTATVGTVTAVTSITNVVHVDDNAGSLTVDGTVSITANSAVNVAQLAGTATSVNSGNKDAGTLRVVLATDQPALTNKLLTTPDLPSGASTAAKQPALGTMAAPSADVLSVQGPGTQLTKAVNVTTTQTGSDVWSPASGKKIAITDLTISAYGTTGGRVILWWGDNADTTYTAGTDQVLEIASFAPSATSKPGLAKVYGLTPRLCTTADRELHLTTDAAISLDITLVGYEF